MTAQVTPPNRLIPALACALALFAAAHKSHADHADLPIFDAHVHYKEPAWGPYPVDRVLDLMDRNGVAMGLVSSTPDEGTIMLWEHAPNRIVPELRPYHGIWGSSDWTDFPGMSDYLDQRRAPTGSWRGKRSTSERLLEPSRRSPRAAGLPFMPPWTEGLRQ